MSTLGKLLELTASLLLVVSIQAFLLISCVTADLFFIEFLSSGVGAFVASDASHAIMFSLAAFSSTDSSASAATMVLRISKMLTAFGLPVLIWNASSM